MYRQSITERLGSHSLDPSSRPTSLMCMETKPHSCDSDLAKGSKSSMDAMFHSIMLSPCQRWCENFLQDGALLQIIHVDHLLRRIAHPT